MENEVKEPKLKYSYISPDEYLEMERNSEEKHEYYDGCVQTMSAASLRHNIISANLIGDIGNFLKGKECRLLSSKMRVCIPSREAYIYPDALIVCGNPELEYDKSDTLVNPAVVFEILSRRTGENDSSYKFLYYQKIPSVREYIMIDSEKRSIQTIRKQENGNWRFENLSQQDFFLLIQTIDFKISLDDIYLHTGL